jgi:isopentenyl diphosphate isomerase/L-lactate dehydrogenase-like FMN-dependent dehydrogenase
LTPDRLDENLKLWRQQMQIALFLTGSPDLPSFRRTEGAIA